MARACNAITTQQQLLEAVFQETPHGFYELRLLPTTARPPERRFGLLPVGFSNLAADLDWAFELNAAGYHAHFGVHPRTVRGGRNDDVLGYAAIVADIDDARLARQAYLWLDDAGLSPSAVVHSGRGVHLYFLPKELVPTAAGKAVGLRLGRWLGGDAVHDPARVLRLPGTLNVKPHVMAMATLDYVNPNRRYSIADISDFMDDNGAPTIDVKAGPLPRALRTIDEDLTPLAIADLDKGERDRVEHLFKTVSPRILKLIQEGKSDDDRYLSRSEADMAVARSLSTAGADDDDITNIFRLNPDGIGDRTFESGWAYLERTINVVRSTAPLAGTPVNLLIRDVGHPRHHVARVLLDVEVLDGPHAGRQWRQGVSLGTAGCTAVYEYVFLSAGLAPPVPPSGAALYGLKGRRALACLRETPKGLEVARWTPRR